MMRGALAALVAAPLLAGCEEPTLTPAAPVHETSPFVYPLELWDRGIEGAAMVLVHVTEAGTVDSALVQQSSGYEAFDSAAVAGARQLQFRPARRGDRRVDSWVRLPVRFSVEGAPEPDEQT